MSVANQELRTKKFKSAGPLTEEKRSRGIASFLEALEVTGEIEEPEFPVTDIDTSGDIVAVIKKLLIDEVEHYLSMPFGNGIEGDIKLLDSSKQVLKSISMRDALLKK